MDFYTAIATLLTCTAVVCSSRRTGADLLDMLGSPHVGAYAKQQAAAALAALGLDADAILAGLAQRVSGHWAMLRNAACEANSAADHVDGWHDRPDYESLPLTLRHAVSGLDGCASEVQHYVQRLGDHGAPTIARLADQGWIAGRGNLTSELDWARAALAGALATLRREEIAWAATPVNPVQLSLHWDMPAPRPAVSPLDDTDWTQVVYPPRERGAE